MKRVYDAPAKSDGLRVLVERLWPRGMTKEAAVIDQWMKEVAPSPALRQWYSHDPEKWPEFQRRYTAELKANEPALAALRALCCHLRFCGEGRGEKQRGAPQIVSRTREINPQETDLAFCVRNCPYPADCSPPRDPHVSRFHAGSSGFVRILRTS
ncbi:MAG: DUF488 domain-containing protein [Pseudomonadota bacterium]